MTEEENEKKALLKTALVNNDFAEVYRLANRLLYLRPSDFTAGWFMALARLALKSGDTYVTNAPSADESTAAENVEQSALKFQNAARPQKTNAAERLSAKAKDLFAQITDAEKAGANDAPTMEFKPQIGKQRAGQWFLLWNRGNPAAPDAPDIRKKTDVTKGKSPFFGIEPIKKAVCDPQWDKKETPQAAESPKSEPAERAREPVTDLEPVDDWESEPSPKKSKRGIAKKLFSGLLFTITLPFWFLLYFIIFLVYSFKEKSLFLWLYAPFCAIFDQYKLIAKTGKWILSEP